MHNVSTKRTRARRSFLKIATGAVGGVAVVVGLAEFGALLGGGWHVADLERAGKHVLLRVNAVAGSIGREGGKRGNREQRNSCDQLGLHDQGFSMWSGDGRGQDHGTLARPESSTPAPACGCRLRYSAGRA